MSVHRRSTHPFAPALALALCAVALVHPGAAAAEEETPTVDRTVPSSFATYPGVYPIYVMEVRSAKTLYVNAAVWPGFQRTFLITVPGIAIPSDNIKAPACEQALAAKAKAFTQAYFKDAERPEIRDVQMQNTALEDGSANAYTEKGSLADALLEKGFARPDSVDPATPWCEEH